MFSYIFLIFIFHVFIFLFLIKVIKSSTVKKKKNKKIYFTLVICIILSFFTSTSIYINRSNYWIGDGIFSKLDKNKNYNEFENFEAKKIFLLLSSLEKDLEKNPSDIEILKKLAKIKYLIGNFESALIDFQKAKEIEPDNLELLIGEANTRAIIEGNTISKETIYLFEEILKKERNNALALLILADNALEKNNLKKAKNYYSKLLSLLKKDSKEYLEIKEKIIKIKEKQNNNE